MIPEAPVLRLPEDLTAEWLQRALQTGPVTGFRVEPIGTGQMKASDGRPRSRASVVMPRSASITSTFLPLFCKITASASAQ